MDSGRRTTGALGGIVVVMVMACGGSPAAVSPDTRLREEPTASIASSAPAAPTPVEAPAAAVASKTGAYRSVGPMAVSRDEASAVLLADGRVLVTGGHGADTSTELWDPTTELFTRTGDMLRNRFAHASVRLSDGRVLVIGGRSWDSPVVEPDGSVSSTAHATVDAEIWDPTTGRFEPAGHLTRALAPLAAWLEPDGGVRVAGGVATDADPPAPPWVSERWDPTTMTFTADAAVVGAALPGVELADGRRIFIGGSTAATWDPASGTFDLAAYLGRGGVPGPVSDGGATLGDDASPLRPSATRALLPDGRILVAGGASLATARSDGANGGQGEPRGPGCGEMSQIWDPATGSLMATGLLGVPRSHFTSVTLADGRVLVIGNHLHCAGPNSAEVFEFR